MDLTEFAVGDGVDTSAVPKLQVAGIAATANVKNFYKTPDNLYSLKEEMPAESLDFVFNDGLINSTKFYKVLLKEWFYLVKVGGYLIIRFIPNKLLDSEKLRQEVGLLFKDGAKIAFFESDKFGKTQTCIVQKKASIRIENDSIDKWTFGIVTNGKRMEQVEKLIESIRKQKVPYYEIIVCGTYFDRKEPDFRYIPFSEHDDKGWITRKKNIICENAKYENLMILHDRFVLGSEWFEGMKRYGNYFDALSCVQLTEEGWRAGDWITSCCSGLPGVVALLDYRDWDKWGYLDGGLAIIKKSVWRHVKWDESLFWNQSEDVTMGHSLTAKGFLLRFNLHSSCKVPQWRHGKLPQIDFSSKTLGTFRGPLKRRLSCYFVRFKENIRELKGKLF